MNYIKQWHKEKAEKTTDETESIETFAPHIKHDIIETQEQTDDGYKVKIEYIPKDVFAKVNETAKIIKQSQMQEILEKINEIEKGL